MAFSLIPREMKFFELFNQATALITSSAAKFVEMATNPAEISRLSQEIKNDELAGDHLLEKSIEALDLSFITPFDREDIHALVTSLESVLDAIEDTAHRLEVFHLKEIPADVVRLVKIIQEACVHVEGAVRLLTDIRRPEQINRHLREIGRLEKEADRIYRTADAYLLDNANGDWVTFIKKRELYTWLEETVDTTQKVALVVSEIVIKGN